MNEKTLVVLKHLLEKYMEEADMKYQYKLAERIEYILTYIKVDLKQ